MQSLTIISEAGRTAAAPRAPRRRRARPRPAHARPPVRGLPSTGLFDAAISATDQVQVGKELTQALHPHQRRDGTVWMANVFRYLIARVR